MAFLSGQLKRLRLARLGLCCLLIVSYVGLMAHEFEPGHSDGAHACVICIAAERLDDTVAAGGSPASAYSAVSMMSQSVAGLQADADSPAPASRGPPASV